MLTGAPPSDTATESSLFPHPDKDLGLAEVLHFLRRRLIWLVGAIAACLVLGVTYLTLAPDEYVATTMLVLDRQKVEIFGSGDVAAESSLANATVETEIQIISSSRVLEAVINDLGLLDDAAFMAGRPGFLDIAVGAVAGTIARILPSRPVVEAARTPAADADLEELMMRRAVALLRRDLEVKRIGLSYGVGITFAAAEPEAAARIANGIASAYLADQVKRNVGAAERLSEWLEARIAELRVLAFGTDLRPEEKSAVRETYDNFVQRYTQAAQQQSLPEADALVITPAVPPRSASAPNAGLVLAGSIFLGAVSGFGLALWRDLLDRRIRTRRQLESAVRGPCLGVLPTFRLKKTVRREVATVSEHRGSEECRLLDIGPWLSVALSAPYSRFAEALRSTKVSACAASYGKASALGVVSPFPGEGKTTVAGNLARLSGVGADVLLVDADLRNPALSHYLVPEGALGLVEVANGSAKLSDVIWSDPGTRLRFLPAGGDAGFPSSSDVLSSAGMRSLLKEARESYDLIVLDLAPIITVADVRAVAPLVDHLVLIAEWGATTEDAATEAIARAGADGKILGGLLNKVTLSRYRRLDRQAFIQSSRGYLEGYREVA